MFCLCSLICKRKGNITKAVFILILFAISPQFWFIGGSVYTDSLSMLFPVLVFWLYLRSKEQSGKKKLITYLLMALAAAIGSLIKITVIIGMIAVLIDMCFFDKPRNLLMAAACASVITAVVMAGFNGYIYSRHLNKDTRDKMMRPYIHWVMMGLHGDGRYNANDYKFTDKFKNVEEKTEKDLEETVKRINKLGVPGLYKLICTKSAIDFGDGTYGISDFLNIRPAYKTGVHDLVLYEGKNYKIYSTYATALHIVLMLGMVLGVILMLIKKTYMDKKLLVPYLALMGIWLFLMCWETNRRYFSNFAPMIFISVSLTAQRFGHILPKRKGGAEKTV